MTANTDPPKDPRDDRIDAAVEYVIGKAEGLDVENIGSPDLSMSLPKGSAEATRCLQVQRILKDYATRAKAKRPLSVAVFGPPGAGKSHCVKALAASIDNCEEPLELNLSQLSQPTDLAEAVTKKLQDAVLKKIEAFEDKPDAPPKSRTLVFFFDEFDAPLNGVALGWLRWFLAPMQDGKIFFGGQSIKIGKAIFMFAGGTAPTLEEFERRAKADLETFHSLKVPDFISRLRGFIDIQGVNNIDDEREVRRALVLRYQLGQRWKEARDKTTARFPIKVDTVRRLLSNVQFVHGARSMEALLDMCRLIGEGDEKDVELPDEEIRKLHLSRGELDGAVVGLSAGLDDRCADAFLKRLTDVLLPNGATVAYGGPIMGAGTLSTVIEAARKLPDELVKREDKRIRNYLGFPASLHDDVKAQQGTGDKHVDFKSLDTLAESECAELGIPKDTWFAARPRNDAEVYQPNRHVAWAISLFRMRVRLVQDARALVVLGGKDDGKSWGRYPGIAEEVMLALAAKKPVYVLGGCGKAAKAVGRLLGMDSAISAPDRGMVEEDNAEFWKALNGYAHCFTMPGHDKLPANMRELRQFFFEHSITTPLWPPNGLTVDENRKLFAMKLDDAGVREAVDVIIHALQRRPWEVRPKAS